MMSRAMVEYILVEYRNSTNCFVWIPKDIWFCIAIEKLDIILGHFNLSYENYCDLIFNQFTPLKFFMIFVVQDPKYSDLEAHCD